MTSGLLDKLARNGQQTPEPGDYRGEDGVLICGTCGQPKEVRMAMDGKGTQLLPISCDCQKAKEAADWEKKELADFLDKLRKMWVEDHIAAPRRPVTLADDDHRDEAVSKVCRRYVENWPKVSEEGLGILFSGPVGVGKSYLAAAIAGELVRQRVPTAIISLPRLLTVLTDSKERQAAIDRLQRYKLLVLDDLGVERDTAFAAECVFNVVDSRYEARLPTIITTNMTAAEMEAPVNMQNARIYSRIGEMCPVRLTVSGGDRRKEEAERRRLLARKILGGKN